MGYFHEFSVADTLYKGVGLAVGLALGGIGLALGLVAGVVGLGLGICATAGAGVIVGATSLYKLYSGGYNEIVNAIEEIPGFNYKLFQDPKKFEDHFDIGNPKFVQTVRRELDNTVGALSQKMPGQDMRMDAKYIASFYPSQWRGAAVRSWNNEIGFSSVIVVDDSVYEAIESYKVKGRKVPKQLIKKKEKASRDYGVIFKYRNNRITDIWCIRFKKIDGRYEYYPYRLKCSDTINPMLYKKRKKG